MHTLWVKYYFKYSISMQPSTAYSASANINSALPIGPIAGTKKEATYDRFAITAP